MRSSLVGHRLRIAIAVMIAATADSAGAQTFRLDIPAQPAATGVEQFAKQTGAQLLISKRHARDRSTQAVAGEFAGVADGLARLLEGSGLEARPAGINTWTIMPVRKSSRDDAGLGGEGRRPSVTDLPEILVQGHYWSMNTGIPRTEDDTQPYVIFEREELQRSGSHTIEDFFRSYLGANTAVSTSDENIQQAGLGRLNLRGLGSVETLVLLDGRRLAPANTGEGYIGQANVSGIPLDSIERIEVLASSASSIYGAHASGGVINIIRKRDYDGLQASVQYGNAVRGDAPERQFGLSGGWNLNEGRTQVSFVAARREAVPLLLGQRRYLQRYRAFAHKNNPDYYRELTVPPLGATPNIRSADGAPLTFDDGTQLGSHFTHVPDGYRGFATDGIGGLLANAGTYNVEYGQTSLRGALEPLTNSSTSTSATVSARHEVTSALTVYAEAAASDESWQSATNTLPAAYVLPGNASSNPFRQPILISVPNVGADVALTTQFDTWRGVFGSIVTLPRNWKLVFDWTGSRSRYSDMLGPPHDLATANGMRDGTFDVLRDLRLAPIAYGYGGDVNASVAVGPADASNRTASLRLAGTLPIRAGAGEPAVTFLLERADDDLDTAVRTLNTETRSLVQFTPARSRTTESAYAEVMVPFFGESNAKPWLEHLDLQVSTRFDKFTGQGAGVLLDCRRSSGKLLPQEVIDRPCPEPDTQIPRATNVASSTSPTYSLRWRPAEDVMLRGSYAKGFLPSYLHQITKVVTPLHLLGATDPLRGGEPIGERLTPTSIYHAIVGEGNYVGGNPDLGPERATSYSAGLVLTPAVIPGLRLSADWTRIEKHDVFYDPMVLLQGNLRPNGQAQFEEVFIRKYPDRLKRAAPSDGFAVGPVIAIDASIMNAIDARSESWDYAADYGRDFASGRLDMSFRGTYLKELSAEFGPGQPFREYHGVVNDYFAQGASAVGGVRKKAHLMAMWTNARWQLGWRVRYVGRYYPRDDRAYIENIGSSVIKSQAYNDLFARYQMGDRTEIRANINNIFDREPPYDIGPYGYSRLADPRQANYSITVSYTF